MLFYLNPSNFCLFQSWQVLNTSEVYLNIIQNEKISQFTLKELSCFFTEDDITDETKMKAMLLTCSGITQPTGF